MSLYPVRHRRNYKLDEIRDATGGFSDAQVIWMSGAAKTYKAELIVDERIESSSTAVPVAVTRYNRKLLGQIEITEQVLFFLKFLHKNLLCLLGTCQENGEMIMIYEYMSNGTLADHLNGKRLAASSLSWEQRLKICIDVAHGLNFLKLVGMSHTRGIVPNFINPINILLEENMVAKLSVFDITKFGRSYTLLNRDIHASNKETNAYVDPDFYLSGSINPKMDVYSFGMVLLEVLCGKLPGQGHLYHGKYNKEGEKLRQWAEENIDTNLKEQISPDCFHMFLDIVEACTMEDPRSRPDMGELVLKLEHLFEFHLKQNYTTSIRIRAKYKLSKYFQRVKQMINLPYSGISTYGWEVLTYLTSAVRIISDTRHCCSGKFKTLPPEEDEDVFRLSSLLCLVFQGILELCFRLLFRLFFRHFLRGIVWGRSRVHIRAEPPLFSLDPPAPIKKEDNDEPQKNAHHSKNEERKDKSKGRTSVRFEVKPPVEGASSTLEQGEHDKKDSDDANHTAQKQEPDISSSPQRLFRQFSLAEIKVATEDFDPKMVCGKGGEAKVYRGNILVDDGGAEICVAVKRLTSEGADPKKEIEMLSTMQHENLVSLLGSCQEFGEKILVYEYMSNGSLDKYLWKTTSATLSWEQRLKICIGAASGLAYLHTCPNKLGHGLIHRDVKPVNILLDENWVAKIADFGLAKTRHSNQLVSEMDTRVRGTPGYYAPEYYFSGKVTRSVDVYAFGIVMFEVLCRKRPWASHCADSDDSDSDYEGEDIRSWAKENIDENLKEPISENCLDVFVDVAAKCYHKDKDERPTMSEVVSKLKYALQLLKSGK